MELMKRLWAFCFSVLSSRVPVHKVGRGVRSREMHQGKSLFPLPASQTLIVPPLQPDTILEPSGEKATELMRRLWAFSLVALRSRVPVKRSGGPSEARQRQSMIVLMTHLRPRL